MSATRWGSAVLFAIVLTRCDKASPLKQEEQRVHLATTISNICPDSRTGQGLTSVVATVYGKDGAVEKGIDVNFSSDVGSFSEAIVATNEAGQATTSFTTPRPPGDKTSVFASIRNGRSDEVELNVPVTPFPSLVPQEFTPQGESEDEFVITVANACNVREVDFSISWTPSDAFTVVHDSFTETNVLNGPETSPIPTEHSFDDSIPGQLAVEYRRTDAPPTGSNASATYLRFKLKAKAVTENTDVEFSASRMALIAYDGRPYELGNNFALPAKVKVIPKTTN